MPDRPSAATWTEHALIAGGETHAAGMGTTLVWAAEPVRVSHGGEEVALDADDLLLVERGSAVALMGQDRRVARVLDLGPASHPDSGKGGLVLDGGHPITGYIRRLWMLGSDLHGHDPDDALSSARLRELIAGLAGRMDRQGRGDARSSHRGAMLDRAWRLVAARCVEPDFAPAALAAAMRISPRHMSSLFADIGTTAGAAILQQRLARASTLLCEATGNRRQIAQVALASGFADASYFARAFRARYGCSPGDFRRQAGQNRTIRP